MPRRKGAARRSLARAPRLGPIGEAKARRANRATTPGSAPVFVIHEGTPGAVTRTIRVFANGRVEGIDGPYAVVNLLPGLLDKVVRAIGDRAGQIAAHARQELGL